MRFSYTVCFFILLSSASAKSFGKDKEFGIWGLDMITGYTYQNLHTLELGMGYGYRGEEMAAMGYMNAHLCTELLFKPQGGYLYGFKAGGTMALAFFSGSLGFNYFTDFTGTNSFAIRPEFGLSYIGLVDLHIGRNILFSKNDPLEVRSFVFSLRFTLGRNLSVDLLPWYF